MKDRSFFSSAADLRQKLSSTVIRYKGEPHHCQADGANEFLFLWKLGDNKENRFKVEPDDRGLDFRSPPLGFVNFDRHCLYVGRIPTRKSVQGLSEASLSYIDLDGKPVGPPSNCYHHTRFRDTIMGVYPTFADTLRRILAARTALSQAFDRSFALRRFDGNEAIALFHRYIPIGEYDRVTNRMVLGPTYDNPIMYRQLGELGVPVNES